MVEFVNLMEARSVGSIDNESDQDKFWYSDQWIMEPVRLGVRYQGLVCTSGQIKFHGKQKNYKEQFKIDSLTKIVDSLKANNLPEQTLFEGYLTFENDRSKAYRFLKLGEIDDDLAKSAQFYVTDIIYHAGQDVFNLPLFDRRTILDKLFKEDELVKIQSGFTKNKKSVFEQLKNEIKVFIFKDLAAKYSFKQSTAWRIYKIPQTYFMTVMGLVESDDPKLKKMIVALEGGQLRNNVLTKIMNVPVHGYDTRTILYNNKENLVGKVFEMLASEKDSKDDKYQEARYIKIREDKKLEDCIYF